MSMNKLVITEELASLPVTDLIHTVDEINKWRRVLELMDYWKRYQRKYNQRLKEKRENELQDRRSEDKV